MVFVPSSRGSRRLARPRRRGPPGGPQRRLGLPGDPRASGRPAAEAILVLLLAAAGWASLRLARRPAILGRPRRRPTLYHVEPLRLRAAGDRPLGTAVRVRRAAVGAVGARRVRDHGAGPCPGWCCRSPSPPWTSPTGGRARLAWRSGSSGRRWPAAGAPWSGRAAARGRSTSRGCSRAAQRAAACPDPFGCRRVRRPGGHSLGRPGLPAVLRRAVEGERRRPERDVVAPVRRGPGADGGRASGLLARAQPPDRRTTATDRRPPGTRRWPCSLAWYLRPPPGGRSIEWLVVEVPGGGLAAGLPEVGGAVRPGAGRRGRAHGEAVADRLPAGARPVVRRGRGRAPGRRCCRGWPGVLAGSSSPSEYPAEWEAVADSWTEADAAGTGYVVLPFSVYRRFEWNDERAVLDPAPRFFPGERGRRRRAAGARRRSRGRSRTAVTRRLRRSAEAALPEAGRGPASGGCSSSTGHPGSRAPPSRGAVVHDGAELRLVDLGDAGEPAQLGPAASHLDPGGDPRSSARGRRRGRRGSRSRPPSVRMVC